MAQKNNAKCSICGKDYYVCSTCKSTKKITPWKTITDTIDCYKIFTVVKQYTNKIVSKEDAKDILEKLNMPDVLLPHIKIVVDEIMSVKTKPTEKSTSKSKE